MKPPVAYYGGKTTLADRIVQLLPEHQHYVEPYCGSLAVLLAKRPSAMETVNDLDSHLVTFWRVLRDRPADLQRVCALTPHARAEHTAAYALDDEDVDDLERARLVWVLLTQGRAGQMRPTGWRHYVSPSNSTMGMPGYLAGYVGRIAPAAERLASVSLECRPALDVIASYGRSPDVCLYVDPPYLGSTRPARGYRHEMGDDADHRALAEALRDCRAAVVLSGYPSDLYDRELYADWARVEFRASTGQGGTWANRTEVLWSNRPFVSQPTLWEAS